MPPPYCCQERLVESLAAERRGSAEHARSVAAVNEAMTRGLDHLFLKNDIDALVFAAELGAPAVWAGAGGYPAV